PPAASARPGPRAPARPTRSCRFLRDLLGLRVVAGDLVALGWRALLLVFVSLIVTVASGFLIARLLRQPRDTASVAATSVAVCGASAALAASAMAPRREGLERDTTVIIIAVSLLSSAVMILYPAIAHLMAYTPQQTSLLLGAAIHDVAQVVGAGFAISPEVGVQAVTVKLIRVACLLPVVMAWGVFHARGRKMEPGANAALPAMPFFLVGFFVLAAIASLGLVPAPIADIGKQSAGWALAAAVAAIGLKTSIGELRSVPGALLVALLGQTLLQLLAVMLLIALLFN
ncbi:MAG: YeiH family protein, partial [Sphingomonadaceae bacterium]